MKSRKIGLDKLHTEMAKLYLQTLEKPVELQIGDLVSVLIKSINDKEFIFIESDIGPGIIPKKQFLDDNQNLTINVGQTILAFYTGNRNGENYFTVLPTPPFRKKILESAKEYQFPFKGKIESILDSGYEILIAEEIAFCPKSKMNKHVQKGDILDFIVIDITQNSVIVSHTDYLKIQKEQYKKQLIQTLKPGSIVSGKISKIKNSGLTIDLGYQLEGFVPLSEISYKRVENLNDNFRINNDIRAKVIHLDWKEDKIILSLKELEKNPWLGELPFKGEDILEVSILQIKKGGLVVKLPENFQGFIPINEIPVKKQSQIHKEFSINSVVQAMIIRIDKEAQKIYLSIKKANEYFEELEYKKYLQNEKNEDTISLRNILFKNENK